MGDINSDYTKTPLDVHTRTLQFISSVYQLKQLMKEPTRVTKSSATTIDSIFTNVVDNMATSGVIQLGISDHSLICVVWKFAVPKTRPTIKEVRNFKHFVDVDFINDLSRISWQNVKCFDDPNLAWQAWKSDCNAILDHYAPVRNKRVRTVPWLTFDIKKMTREQDYHKKHAIKYGSHNHWILYQSARNKVNSMMRKGKSGMENGCPVAQSVTSGSSMEIPPIFFSRSSRHCWLVTWE